MKILLLDLETSPNMAYVWGLWNQNISIGQMISSTEVICFGARWYGQRKIHFSSVHHDGKTDMLKAIHELLDEADAVVGWNSAGFDVKHLYREFIENDMLPPSPHKEIDLLRVARSRFRFPSNKLDYVAQKLGMGAKVKHSGFELWIKCLAGDDKAWREMKKYQIQDVNLLVGLYEKFLPWIKNHPNRALLIINLRAVCRAGQRICIRGVPRRQVRVCTSVFNVKLAVSGSAGLKVWVRVQ
jgi:hypothetical protein